MKIISVLGSTGSIGTQALEVVRNNKDLQVSALAASSNITLLEEQIREFHPKLVCVYDREKAQALKNRISDLDVIVEAGMEGLIACATEDSADIIVSAVVGMIGIKPVMEAILKGKDIAFANKETLVTAGHLIMPLVKKHNVNLLPVDSEHSAIFQCLQGNESSSVSRIILTASGGPFRGKTLEELKYVKVEDALKHPNWEMGRKITIDSATMVNKGLEVMEAHWLFHEPLDKIEVVIQPQSIIHSAVEFEDGGIIAQLGTPDMKLPIQYALYYPDKRRYLPGKHLDFFDIGQITFEKPNINHLPGLRLAYEAMKEGHSVPTVFNAANELAVAKFLKREISFLSITALIEKAMENVSIVKEPSLDEILNVEQETYDFIERECVKANYHI